MIRTLFGPLAVLIALVLSLSARGQMPEPPDPAAGIGIDQKMGAQVPRELAFVDDAGKAVRLSDYLGGRPLVLVPVYYRCPMLCQLILDGVVRGLSDLPFTAGKEFEVVAVSVDPKETPEVAAASKKAYLKEYGRGDGTGWHFLTGQEEAIKPLMDAIGFRYAYDPKTGQYAHAAGLMIVTPEGKLARYFYGIEYLPRDLRFALMEASKNKIGSPVDRVLMRCFEYDPETGKYGFMIRRAVQAGGALTVLTLGTFMAVMFRRDLAGGRG